MNNDNTDELDLDVVHIHRTHISCPLDFQLRVVAGLSMERYQLCLINGDSDEHSVGLVCTVCEMHFNSC